MAKKNQPQIIMKKVIGHVGNRYNGVLTKISQIHYELTINEMVEEVERVETKEIQTRDVRVKCLRPLAAVKESLTAQEKNDRQKLIDKYLEDSTVDDAITEKETKDETGKVIKARAIEVDLGFQVEYWIDTKRESIEVPVAKDEITTSYKKVGSVPFYFRPQTNHVVKSMSNYLKTNIK
jgi:hypothetical protein